MTDSHDTPPATPDPSPHSWREIYLNGSPEAEEAHFRDLARTVVGLQQANRRESGAQVSRRTFHAEIVAGVDNAELAFRADLPADCAPG